ncbi:anti-sigma factor family protein [Paraburkholderia rhizosphaerae]|uniref:Anti-sigma factor RsiW n=1 Tax=Paraburkholderia rhizosphaerae TaxID=480658 RepID=A0A4R8LI10_9BURK|nr:anti-sigma factor [Paraburkholderia rhizosphaerae]TDY42929.1 anti-sigma factor RsiW [Paraburkholderia rhizosphaerae]
MNNDAHHPESAPDLRMLSAFVDDELSDREKAAVREHLAHDEQAAAQVAAWRAQKAALRALCGGVASRDDAQFMVLRSRSSWWRRTAIAACWLVAGAGLTLALQPLVPRLTGGETMSFARRADIAYAVYTPEQRHPVEVAAAEEEHLINWLSKRLNRKLSVPSLQEYGYSLVGGRLLPGEAGPAAQFMYENQTGGRLTLYATGVPKDETAFRLFRDGNRRTFYWVSDGMGYALSGPIAEGKLRSIAIDVCSALGGRPEAWQ